MRICLDVTWPIRRMVCLPIADGLASDLNPLRGELRQDLVYFDEDRLCIRGLFGRENKVPDVDRYRVVNRGGSIAVEDHGLVSDERYVSTYPYVDRPASAEWEGATLVIVLESPHRDEYGGAVRTPIAPARGATGARIHNYLCNILNCCARSNNLLLACAPVRVIISNPIPFQTSAFAIHGGRLCKPMRLRDVIWRGLWWLQDANQIQATQHEDDQLPYVFQRMFQEKLERYTPTAIVNACTRTLRPKITEALRKLPHTIELYEADRHPSGWRCDNTGLTPISRP